MAYKKSTIIKEGQDKPLADKNRHYVDKKEFYNALVERSKEVEEAKEKGEPIPQISDYIGECLLNIANGLARKYQFSGYAFKDEMVMDAVLHCLKYVDAFDIEKSKNPFSYFTQAAYYQFIKRINDEKKAMYIKCKTTMRGTIFNSTAEKDEFKNDKHINDNMEMDTEFMDSFIEDFETKEKEKREKQKQKALEKKQKDQDDKIDLF